MEKQEIRKNKSIEIIKNLGITVNEGLPCVEDSSEVKLKNLDEICKRAIACLFSIQVACDINQNNDYKESVNFFKKIMQKFEVENSLNSKDKRIFDGSYSAQDSIDMDWAYESYWVLVWALGFVDDIKDGGELCDCLQSIQLVINCENYEDFKSKCKLRDVEEILDMLDLYFRYHWALVDNKFINSETKIGDLNYSLVVERRRAFEWLVSDKEDWYEISLDT